MSYQLRRNSYTRTQGWIYIIDVDKLVYIGDLSAKHSLGTSYHEDWIADIYNVELSDLTSRSPAKRRKAREVFSNLWHIRLLPNAARARRTALSVRIYDTLSPRHMRALLRLLEKVPVDLESIAEVWVEYFASPDDAIVTTKKLSYSEVLNLRSARDLIGRNPRRRRRWLASTLRSQRF